MNVRRLGLFSAFLVLSSVSVPDPRAASEAEDLVRKMQSAYARIQDYRMRVDSTVRERGNAPAGTHLWYRFQRPDRVRIDFLEPHPGMVLVYPTASGKVRIQFGGLLRFLRISLDRESASLRVSPGQRIDQTDLGLLVHNISRSLTSPDSTRLSLSTTPGFVIAEVEADNHFQPGVRTHYRFWIDRARWLPMRIEEAVPARGWEREISFSELETNVGLSTDLFRLE